MKEFTDVNKETCKTVLIRSKWPHVERSLKKFLTRSTYKGTWDLLGMSGFGIYTFPQGVKYKGHLEDGKLHGDGELQYPNGAILRGKFYKGRMIERTLVFADGVEYSETGWKYYQYPDRSPHEERTILL